MYATHDGMVKVSSSSRSVQVHLMSSNIIATNAYFEFKDDFQFVRQLERKIHRKLQALLLNYNNEELTDLSRTAKCEIFKRYVIDEEQSKDRWGEIYETVKAEIQSSQRCIGWCSSSEMFDVDE